MIKIHQDSNRYLRLRDGPPRSDNFAESYRYPKGCSCRSDGRSDEVLYCIAIHPDTLELIASKFLDET
jgi:hypothetical protein